MIALLAHVGGGIDGLWDGLVHPFLGLDHVLAMVTVGVLAMTMARPLAAPGVFLGGVALGGALGIAGVPAPGAEIAIALSVVALAAVLIAGPRLRSSTVFVLVGAAALVHGHAHGAEAPSAAAPLVYVVGFVIATAALAPVGRRPGNTGAPPCPGTGDARRTGHVRRRRHHRRDPVVTSRG